MTHEGRLRSAASMIVGVCLAALAAAAFACGLALGAGKARPRPAPGGEDHRRTA